MLDLMATVDAAHEAVQAGGGERYVARHRERGNCWSGSASSCCSTATRRSSSCRRWPAGAPTTRSAAGSSPGIGVVEGVECVISANDPTVRGGAVDRDDGGQGRCAAQEIARRNRLPLINLTESAGADLPRQADIFVPGGATFRDLTQLSARGIPTITPRVRAVDGRRRVRARA